MSGFFFQIYCICIFQTHNLSDCGAKFLISGDFGAFWELLLFLSSFLPSYRVTSYPEKTKDSPRALLALAGSTWKNRLKRWWKRLTVRLDSGWLRVARGGSGAKAPPLAERPSTVQETGQIPDCGFYLPVFMCRDATVQPLP